MATPSIIPQADGFYFGTVKDVNKYGLKVELNGFSKKAEGIIHSSELFGDLGKLVTGDLIKVKVIGSSSDGFISITAQNIEQPINKARNNARNDSNQVFTEFKRKIRVASPARKEVCQYTCISSSIDIDVVKDDPPFLKSISIGHIPSKILKQLNIFKDPNSNMARTAKKMTQSQPVTSAFYFTESNFTSSWTKSSNLNSLFDQLSIPSLTINKSSTNYRQRTKMTIQEQRKSLPIYQFRDQIIKDVINNPILIVIAETGSGKTTQIPQYLFEGGFIMRGKIACTQPRRFAAMSVAARVAEEYGCVLGKEVGYKIRFDDSTEEGTIIKYMTDGILLRECLSDENLDKYSCIIIDEAHERTIYTDVLFGLLKEAVKRRPQLRVIISSATLDSAKFSKFFDNAKVLSIPGMMYPIEIFYYRYHVADYFNTALNTVLNIHMRESDGDILLFLTGQDEIEKTCEQLENYVSSNRSRFNLDLIVLPMFSSLPNDMQSDVLEPAPRGSRKVIVATNIAEASVTIDGIKFVVDCGYAKQKFNDPKIGMDMLQVIPISQASANQRMGRAGRTAPGKCYRLYSEEAYDNEMLPETIPEIQRSDLANVILHLKAIGINDILNFDFMDPPPKDNILASLKQLYLLEALDRDGKITELGRQMVLLPVDPNLAKMLIISDEMKCADEIITIVAMLSVGNVFYRPRKLQALADEKKRNFEHPVGDHLRLLNIYKKWEQNYFSSEWCKTNFLNEKKLIEAEKVRQHLLAIMDRNNYEIYSAGYNYERIQMTITSGFFQNIAKVNPTLLRGKNKSYKILDQPEYSDCYIHPSSSLFHQIPSWIVFNNLTETSKKFMNVISVINPEWLKIFAKRLYN